MSRTLVICYGNPGRLDDGIGAAFAKELQKMQLPGIEIDVDYQLSVEHAAAIAEYREVLFIDAAVSGPEPYFVERLTPQPALSFSSHSVEPTALLALASELFGAATKGFALGIRGYVFNAFGEHLSSGALGNIQMALKVIEPALRRGELDRLANTDQTNHCTFAQPCDQRAPASKGDLLCQTQSA